MVDEDLLERGVHDLEVGHPNPAADGGREERVGLDSGVQLDLGPIEAGAEDPDAGDLIDPGQPVVALDRDLHEAPTGCPSDVPHGATDDDPPAIDDRDRLAERFDRLHLMRGEDQCPALVAQLEEGLAEQRHVHRIETRKRLVHQEHLRIVEDCRDQLDLLLIAFRQLLRPPAGQLGNAEPGQPMERLATRPLGREAVERREIGELVDDDHPRIEAALLGQVAPRRAGKDAAVDSLPRHRSAIGLEDAEDDPHRRRLARAVGAEEAEYLAARNFERESVEGHGRAESLVEMVDEQAHAPRISPHPQGARPDDGPVRQKMSKLLQGFRRRITEADP